MVLIVKASTPPKTLHFRDKGNFCVSVWLTLWIACILDVCNIFYDAFFASIPFFSCIIHVFPYPTKKEKKKRASALLLILWVEEVLYVWLSFFSPFSAPSLLYLSPFPSGIGPPAWGEGGNFLSEWFVVIQYSWILSPPFLTMVEGSGREESS